MTSVDSGILCLNRGVLEIVNILVLKCTVQSQRFEPTQEQVTTGAEGGSRPRLSSASTSSVWAPPRGLAAPSCGDSASLRRSTPRAMQAVAWLIATASLRSFGAEGGSRTLTSCLTSS